MLKFGRRVAADVGDAALMSSRSRARARAGASAVEMRAFSVDLALELRVVPPARTCSA
jgi:hypothetical protein